VVSCAGTELSLLCVCVLLIARVGGRTGGGTGCVSAQSVVEAGKKKPPRGGVESRRTALPRRVWPFQHRSLLAGLSAEAFVPSVPASGWAGRCLAVVPACAGPSLVVHRDPRPPWNTRVVVRPRGAAAVRPFGPYRFFSHPNVRFAVVVEGIAVARLWHTAWSPRGVHGASCRCAAHAYRVENAGSLAMLDDLRCSWRRGPAGWPPRSFGRSGRGSRSLCRATARTRRQGMPARADAACSCDVAGARCPDAPGNPFTQNRHSLSRWSGAVVTGGFLRGRRARSACAGRRCVRACWRPSDWRPVCACARDIGR